MVEGVGEINMPIFRLTRIICSTELSCPSIGAKKSIVSTVLLTKKKSLPAFDVVAEETNSTGSLFSSATFSTTYLTLAGSFRFPRKGCGVKKGKSVSTNKYSKGINPTTFCKGCAFLM